MRKIILWIFKKALKLFSSHKIGRFRLIKIIWVFLFSHFYLFLKKYTDAAETSFMKKVIKPGDVVLDIGACLGYYTLLFAKIVGETGRVFAFEPNPENFALLKKNVDKNGYKNIILANKAVSNETGKIKMYLSEYHKADHRIYDSGDGREAIAIEAMRLDDYFKNYNGQIDFIKIDVQGAEGKVIQGMALLLQKNKALKIFTEFWPWGIRNCGLQPEEYVKLLLKHNFQIYHFNEQGNKIELADIQKLIATHAGDILEKDNCTNLFLIPNK